MAVATIIWTFLVAHQLVVLYVWAAFCNSWPSPKLDSSMFYQGFFKFISSFGANPARAFSSSLPVAKEQVRKELAKESVGSSAAPPYSIK